MFAKNTRMGKFNEMWIWLLYLVFILTEVDISHSTMKVTQQEHSINIVYYREFQSSGGSDDYSPIEMEFDTTFNKDRVLENCGENNATDINGHVDGFCYKWGEQGTKTHLSSNKDEAGCHFYDYETALKVPIKVTFHIKNMHLYGGAEQSNQLWPLEKYSLEPYPYISTELNSQAVLESYWLDSKGTYLYVDKSVPLFISLNRPNQTFALISNAVEPYVRKSDTTLLRYAICSKENAREAHENAIQKFLGKPSAIPDKRMVQHPSWSTWAKYKTNINESTVLKFADKILKHGFENSQLEIDDSWETCYGSLTPDTVKFPNFKKLVTDLKNKGFRVTLWVHPFINTNCEPLYSDAKRLGYLVKNAANHSTITSWWNGEAGYIDFTNSDAATWYKNRLRKLKIQTGLDSYKFDAGESSWSPQIPVFDQMEDDHPETILKKYIETAAQFGNMIEVRSARGTQKYPIFVRMMDRETNWSFDRGVSSLVTTVIQMNMIGYPFVLPDIIGGNVYQDPAALDEELFIRWLQACVFMPGLQFSFPPWDISETALKLSKKFVDLHYKYSEKIISIMHKATITGAPVNPPIWWIDPTDPQSLENDSEYLLGEDILVAPVLQKGAKSRDIYLPKGVWRDEVKEGHPLIEGRTLLKNYQADLDILPYFTRVEGSNSSSSIPSTHFFAALAYITIILVLLY